MTALASRIGFPETGLDLLRQALTHPAYFEGRARRREDNQRLEFLGDAVLDLLVGEYLYRAYPDAHEGELSKMRAFIVCEASLSEAALALGLPAALRLGRGSDRDGDRNRASILADAFEAMVGAMFLCVGAEPTRAFLVRQFGPRMDVLTPDDYEDKKSRLQEIVQARVAHGVSYRLLEVSGPDHRPHFTSAVYCGKLELGRGSGGSKKESEEQAAQAALRDQAAWLERIE